MDKFGKATKELALQMEQDEREVIAELLKKRTFKHRRHGGKYGEKPPPFFNNCRTIPEGKRACTAIKFITISNH